MKKTKTSKVKDVTDKDTAQKFFQDNNYIVVTEAVSKDVISFIYNYFQVKRDASKILLDTKNISPFDGSWGDWTDSQIPNTFSIYGDTVMDTLMLRTLPTMQRVTGMSLIPTYSYARMYKHGDELTRHKDRDSCEISCTINLGGDNWPIFLEPSGDENKPGVAVNLNPGDMLTYKGVLVEHWREPFEGTDCGQVFCHYNDSNGPYGSTNKFDTRPAIGLPSWTKQNNNIQ